MPFDWTNFGTGVEDASNNLIANRFAKSPIGGAYNAFAPAIGTPLIGQNNNQQPSNNIQQQETNPQDAVVNHWKDQQPASEQPLQFDNPMPQNSGGAKKIAGTVAALIGI